MMSMTDDAFKTWLIQPGSHRRLQIVRKQLSALLGKEAEVGSWSDLYRWFEVAMTLDEDHRLLFEPIFEQVPPSDTRGATDRQMWLYRGARLPDDKEPTGQGDKPCTITYRGRTVEQPAEGGEPTSARRRYYRGAKVDSD